MRRDAHTGHAERATAITLEEIHLFKKLLAADEHG